MKSRPLSYAVLWECIQGRHIARHKQERTLIDTQSVHEACPQFIKQKQKFKIDIEHFSLITNIYIYV